MTYREIIYICLDQVKLSSEDSYFTEDHVKFLLSKVRAALLERKYSTIKREVSQTNYQTLCIPLEIKTDGGMCGNTSYLKSKDVIPTLLNIGTFDIYSEDFYNTSITLVSRERMKYVGHNKWLKNIIYASIGPDNYLYLKGSNPQHLYLKNLKMTGIFEEPDKVSESCNTEDNKCQDPLDKEFPLEEALVGNVINAVVQLLLGASYRPEDSQNDDKDALSDLITYIRQNVKSNLQKQLDEVPNQSIDNG